MHVHVCFNIVVVFIAVAMKLNLNPSKIFMLRPPKRHGTSCNNLINCCIIQYLSNSTELSHYLITLRN